MNKINMYEIYKALFKALKSVYAGDLYLIIESVTVEFDSDEFNEILALEPFNYIIKGRYGREASTEENYLKLDESFSLRVDVKYTPEMIQALFTEELLNK